MVAAFFAGLADFLRDPVEYIWSVILAGISKRLSQIGMAILAGLP